MVQEEMKRVRFSASPKQLSRLRNGHKVRIKAPIEGKGCYSCYISPGKFSNVGRQIGRGKGVELVLSPDEILANQQARGSMEGEGIFDDIGKAFKATGKVIKPYAKQIAKGALPALKQGAEGLIDMGAEYAPQLLSGALSAGAMALGQPELVPGAMWIGDQAGKALGNAGKKALKKELKKGVDKADRALGSRKSEGNKGATTTNQRAGMANSLEGQQLYDRSLGAMNNALGTNMGYMGRAGLAGLDFITLQALADEARQKQMSRSTAINTPDRSQFSSQMVGNRGGMSWVGGAGEGLYAGKGRGIYAGKGFRASGGQIGGKGERQLPPALQSQPYSANFQFQHTLPPKFQHS
tara:strand:- start:139 stop:1194 length:1056 start_codon:yes stop_codon:yes gene_type:complete